MEMTTPNPFMDPDNYQDKVLAMMRKYELRIGELYSAYAGMMPEHATLWNHLAREEGTHAYWLETLALQIGNKQIYFDDKRFNIVPLTACILDVELRLAEAKKETVGFFNALVHANEIEDSMIERKFFEVYASDSAEIKHTFGMLQDATAHHRKKVEEALELEAKALGELQVKKPGFFSRWF